MHGPVWKPVQELENIVEQHLEHAFLSGSAPDPSQMQDDVCDLWSSLQLADNLSHLLRLILK